jgi:hypothetical protein
VEVVDLDEPVRAVRNCMPVDASLAEICQEVIEKPELLNVLM